MMLGSDPQTFKESYHDPIWQASMDEEFDLLKDNKTWEQLLTSREETSSVKMGLQDQDGL